MRSSVVVVVVSSVVCVAGCVAGCGGVDFDAVDGKEFGRSGSLLTQAATVVVDFRDPAVVTVDAVAKDGDTVTDSGTGVCDRDGDADEGAFETRLSTIHCTFTFEVTTTTPPAEQDIPDALVIGFRNLEDDGSVEIDPSLEAPLPFPLSFADDYARLDLVEE